MDPFLIFLAEREIAGTDSYMHAYALAREASRIYPGEIARIKNATLDEWLIAFQDGEIVTLRPPDPDAWRRGLHIEP
jgi:hypothetical protein